MTLGKPNTMVRIALPTLDDLYSARFGKLPEAGYRGFCLAAWDAALAAGAAAAAEAKDRLVKEGHYHAAAAALDAEKILTAMRTAARPPSPADPAPPAS